MTDLTKMTNAQLIALIARQASHIQELEETFAIQHTDIQAKEFGIQALNNKLTDANSLVAIKDKRIQLKNEELEHLHKSLMFANASSDMLKETLRKCQEEKRELEEYIVELESENNDLQEQNNDLSMKLIAIKENIEDLF